MRFLIVLTNLAKDDFTTKELVDALRSWGMLEPYNPDWAKTRKEIIETGDFGED